MLADVILFQLILFYRASVEIFKTIGVEQGNQFLNRLVWGLFRIAGYDWAELLDGIGA